MKNFSKRNKIPIIVALFLILVFLPVVVHATTCTNDAGCASGEFCSGGTESGGTSGICLEDFAEGNACDRPAQCPTPYCAEGICSATPPAAPSGTDTTTPPSTTTPSKPPSQELINPLGGTTASPGGVTSVPALIANIIKTILGVVGAVALFMFVWGGFGWLTSGGNPDKVKQGRDTLVWATIGLLVIFASYTLVDVVFRALGAI